MVGGNGGGPSPEELFITRVRRFNGVDVLDPWQGVPARVNLQERRFVRLPQLSPALIAAIEEEWEALAPVLAGEVLAIQVGAGGNSVWYAIGVTDAIKDRALLPPSP